MSVVLNLSKQNYTSFLTDLRQLRGGKMHVRWKHPGAKATFVTANAVAGKAEVEGRVSGAFDNHATYRFFANPGSGQVLLAVFVENPAGPYSDQQAAKDVSIAIKQMMKDVKKVRHSGPTDHSNWKGFYLVSTGQKKVGTKGKATLALAVAKNQISTGFRDYCVRTGFTMMHF